MKVLFLIPYPIKSAPSQRFHFEQNFELLKLHGFALEVRPFIGTSTWNSLYKKGNLIGKIAGICLGFLKRFGDLIRAPSADFVFIHREAAPVGPPIFEWIIAKILRKRIIYDFDDAIWLPNTSKENFLVAGIKWHKKVGSICRWSWRISCGNNFLADFAKSFNENVTINPSTINTDYHDPRKWGISEEQPITIGWTGSHSTLKYLDLINPVLSDLEKSLRFRFLVISNKPPDFKLRSLEFRQWDYTSEISDLTEIDIGVMPLTNDTWSQGKCGFKALQYMALEIPTLTSPVGVNAEIIEDGSNGLHCPNVEDWRPELSGW